MLAHRAPPLHYLESISGQRWDGVIHYAVNTLAGETSGDSAKDVTVDLKQLAGYNLANHLFWVTVDNGTITKIAEQFLP